MKVWIGIIVLISTLGQTVLAQIPDAGESNFPQLEVLSRQEKIDAREILNQLKEREKWVQMLEKRELKLVYNLFKDHKDVDIATEMSYFNDVRDEIIRRGRSEASTGRSDSGAEGWGHSEAAVD